MTQAVIVVMMKRNFKRYEPEQLLLLPPNAVGLLRTRLTRSAWVRKRLNYN